LLKNFLRINEKKFSFEFIASFSFFLVSFITLSDYGISWDDSKNQKLKDITEEVRRKL